MKTLLLIISFLSMNQCQSQIDKNDLIDKSWGEISDNVPNHRGKAGLIIMKLYADNTFQAYENTDYAASILQSGKWSLENQKIIFDVLKTKKSGNHNDLKGKILTNKEKGEIEYEVLELTNEKLVLFNKQEDKKLIFEITDVEYGVK